MKWVSVKGDKGICQIGELFVYFKRLKSGVEVHVRIKTEDDFATITGLHRVKLQNLSRTYSTNSGFFKDLKSSLIDRDIDIRSIIDDYKAAVRDVQLGDVTLELPKEAKLDEDFDDEDRYILDLDADVQGTLRPSDTHFNAPDDYIIFEPCWLPYRDMKNNVCKLYPSIIVKTPEGIEIKRYYDGIQIGPFFVSGSFPSSDLNTLITLDGVKSALEFTPELINGYIEKIDKEIGEALDSHVAAVSIKKILIKRWIEGTYFYNIMSAYPILNIMGPSESGKSRLGMCLVSMCYHGDPTLDLTEAGIFRSKEELKPTIVIDEAEYLAEQESHKKIRLLINASYSKGLGFVHRYDDFGGARIRVKFDLYSPMAIIAINPITGITASRTLAVNMVRVDKDMPKATPWLYRDLRNMLYILKFNISDEIWSLYHTLDISEFVTARFDELFRPLFVLTKIFGTDEEYQLIGKWASRYQRNFRISAINITKERDLLLILHKMVSPEGNHNIFNGEEYVLLKELAGEMSATYGSSYTSASVSTILRALGFDDRRRSGSHGHGGLTQARTSLVEVERIMRTYGIFDVDEDSE